MPFFQINDWDNAYANAPNIPNGGQWPNAWIQPAAEYRATQRGELNISYGPHPRNTYDLFLPAETPKGLMIFIHGGFWLRLDKSYWSHLAEGAVSSGWAVAIPSYALCPEVGIAEIVAMVKDSVVHAAAKIDGPIVIAGHSAGGHLATILACLDSPLDAHTRSRISNVVSISGLHDLRPLLQTSMNTDLKLDQASATALSPALKRPINNLRLTTWVGGAERAEFRRQSALLANMWLGLGANTLYFEEPDCHHFNVIDGLADRESALMRTALAPR